MKKILNIKYIIATVGLITGFLASTNSALAAWVYTPVHDVVYIVSGANISPSCNAGVDRSITLPTNSITIPVGGAVVSDSDGTIASQSWAQVGATPSVATVSNSTTLTPTFSNLIQGSYTFRLSATDNLGATCTDDMNVTVSNGNIPPVSDAGVDQSITLPSNSVSVSGSGSYDSDGAIISYAWTKTSGPATYTITAPSSMNTSITGLVAGTYVFQLVVTDNGTPGLTGSDTMTVTVSSEPSASGSLTISPNSCTIALGGSTCSVTGATWNTSGASSPNLLDANTSTTLSTLANNAFPLEVWAAYPFTTFNLRDGSTVLDTEIVTANCGVNVWNAGAGRCVAPAVNGVCGAAHFNCSAGSYPGGGTGGSSGPWAWSCVGSNGGTTASCSEDPSGKPQCSDGIDNDLDGFTDYPNDSGCTSDADNSESNIKIDVKEN